MTEPEYEADDILRQSLGKSAMRNAGPPSELTATVMRQVAEIQKRLSPWQRWKRARRAAGLSRRLPRSRVEAPRPSHAGSGLLAGARAKVLIGLATAAVVLIAVYAGVGFPPGGRGTEGAIGAGSRERIEPAELQQFLQSDSWGRLTKSKEMRAGLSRILSDRALASALSRPEVVATLGNADFAAALSSRGAAGVLSDASFKSTLEQSPALVAALSDASFQAALLNLDFQAALSNAPFRAALADPAQHPSLQASLDAAGAIDR
jgi:hypothetical protein